MKIQTIHAFCSSLLRRFPLEAAVPPDFSEVEDRSLQQLRMEVLNRFAQGPEAAALKGVMLRLNEASLGTLLAEIGKHRDAFSGDTLDFDALFDLPPGFSADALTKQVFPGGESDLFAALIPFLNAGKSTDIKLAKLLHAAMTPTFADLPAFESMLLFGETAKAGPFSAKLETIPTKDTRNALPPALREGLGDLMLRVEAARPMRLALDQRDAAITLDRFARLWLPAFDAAKAHRGWLDFDDLIRLARRLLGSSDVAQWVLFKLDGGIDHILVDEAQDTSPEQWQVIDLLTQEFTAGLGARDDVRTIFVVGDRKQSIYSFQGADLTGFEATRALFQQRLSDVGQGLNMLELAHSFRSSDAILRLVDACFSPAQGANGLGGSPQHLAFHGAMPGRVDLWPALEKASAPDNTAWDDPLDRPTPDNPDIVLAGHIAATIRRMIDDGVQIDDKKAGPRGVHEGDFLILVRRRALLFEHLIRACKAEGLAMAGADRLVLSEELAVQDVIALLRFLALPEDDLSLAVALRSPLLGWTEDALFRLAHGRRGYLWEALRNDPEHAETREILDDLRGQVDFLRPYELIERILTRHDGRRRIRARFGAEVDEAIEAFVDLALSYETGQVPSLDGFLGWLAASDAEVKRQSESAGRRVRVMTVHGAKGLEAPIVILPDTASRRPPPSGVLVRADGQPMLRAPKVAQTDAQRAAAEAEDRLRADESDRLLYVALTRAEKWLIVCGAGDVEPETCWYARVAAAMTDLAPVALDTPTGPGLRHQHGVWPSNAVAAPRETVEIGGLDLPEVPRPIAERGLISPSGLGGAKALAGDGAETETALARGTLIHRLLEELAPLAPADRGARARDLAADDPASMAEALACLDAPALAAVFAPDALCEVALSGDWNGRALWGVIDRLIVTEDRALAVDFKSNRVVPETPEAVPDGLLRQMGAYAHLLAALYPGRRIETALVWTATQALMPLPNALTDAALGRAALDPALGSS